MRKTKYVTDKDRFVLNIGFTKRDELHMIKNAVRPYVKRYHIRDDGIWKESIERTFICEAEIYAEELDITLRNLCKVLKQDAIAYMSMVDMRRGLVWAEGMQPIYEFDISLFKPYNARNAKRLHRSTKQLDR